VGKIVDVPSETHTNHRITLHMKNLSYLNVEPGGA
jgi:hypothetical protein